MTHRTLAITGATSGIGRATAKRLADDFDEIILLVRNVEKGEKFKEELMMTHDDIDIDIIECDLSSLTSIRTSVRTIQAKYEKIDCLINNAGVVSLSRKTTDDDFEMMMGTNYIGHYLLTHHLFSLIMNSETKQIVIVSSNAYAFTTLGQNYFTGKGNAMNLYGRSKLATLYFMQELDEQFREDGLYVTAVHPGAVSTNLGKTPENEKFGRLVYGILTPFFKTSEEGAESTILAVRDKEKYAGRYMHSGEDVTLKPHGQSYYARKQLIRNTMKELGLNSFMDS